MARKRTYLLLAAALLYVGAVAALVGSGVAENGGRFTYSLDDAYIHMAIAANLAEHGVWGVSPEGFASASSSILWPPLVAAFFLPLGRAEWVPLALNVAFGLGALAVVGRLLGRAGLPLAVQALGLSLFAFLTPLPGLALTGMEHTAHVFLSLLFLERSLRFLDGEEEGGGALGLGVVAALMTAARIEGLFLAFPVCVFLLLRRRVRAAFLIGGLALAPVVAFGVVSKSFGWEWLPNSVLLKGSTPQDLAARGMGELLGGKALRLVSHDLGLPLGALAVAAVLLAGVHWRRARALSTAAVSFVVAAALNLELGSIGWLYRYEAWLVGLGVVIALLFVADALRPDASRGLRIASGLVLGAVLAVAGTAGAKRGVRSAVDSAHAMNDRYLNHVMVAELVQREWPGTTLAVNDLGAFAFYTDARLLDVYGLGSLEPLQRRWEGGYTAEHVERWARNEGCELAILQVEWDEVAGRIPASWVEVAEWVVPRNVVFGDTRVGFFATSAAGVASLRETLRRVEPPARVRLVFERFGEGADGDG